MIAAVGLLTIAAGTASAGPILTFGFTELDGNFNGSNTFSANVAGDTDGDVTRKLPVSQTAWYHADFTTSQAGYALNMTLANLTATTADGAGSLTITDVDGDTITADIGGMWFKNGIFAFFNGLLSNVSFNSTGDGIFEGPSAGAFSLDFTGYGAAPYNGAITTLETGQWFVPDVPWENQSTLVQGSVVPEPASLGLICMGIAVALRRRAA
jgi:hypothetical protein